MMLNLEHIHKEYLRGSRRIIAVKDVSLQVEKEDFIHIIGKSGSGKTTLLNILTGMLQPTSGVVQYNQQPFSTLKDTEKCRLRNQHIGVVSQGTASFPNLTVLENVMLPACIYYDKQNDVAGRAMHILSQLGLEALAQAYPKELSGGEARRMLIARALINSPALLVADEPCSDLDSENTRIVMELFQKLNQEGMTILVVSHDLDTLSYGNKTYTMVEGSLMEGNQIAP